jgi:hypothetical protein
VDIGGPQFEGQPKQSYGDLITKTKHKQKGYDHGSSGRVLSLRSWVQSSVLKKINKEMKCYDVYCLQIIQRQQKYEVKMAKMLIAEFVKNINISCSFYFPLHIKDPVKNSF